MRKPRIGVFGLRRGFAHVKSVNAAGGVLAAVCDRDSSLFARCAEYMAADGGYYQDFDEFLKADIDAVVIANYFPQHAEYAVKAMKAGKAVYSECIPAATMADCVKLVRTVEETGMVYCFGENYPYTAYNQEMRRVYMSGRLGEVVFAEGEYVHPMSPDTLDSIAPSRQNETAADLLAENPPKYHWRRYLPKTYYVSHSISPLMFMTERWPKDVTCFPALLEEEASHDSRYSGEAAAPMLVGMDNGAIFRVTAGVHYGPSDNWYRLACTEGGVESVRGNRTSVRLSFNPDKLPAGVTKAEQVYTPKFPHHNDEAMATDHGGGDFFALLNFMNCLTKGEKPFFDVYRAVAISELAIMGWRSAVAGGVRFEIPDLRLEKEREKWQNDCFTPFPDPATGEGATLPCCTKNIKTDYYDKKAAKEVK